MLLELEKRYEYGYFDLYLSKISISVWIMSHNASFKIPLLKKKMDDFLGIAVK